MGEFNLIQTQHFLQKMTFLQFSKTFLKIMLTTRIFPFQDENSQRRNFCCNFIQTYIVGFQVDLTMCMFLISDFC